MAEHPATWNKIKRDGSALTPDQIRAFVDGVVDGSVGDAQLGAFLMAVCCRGMTVAETSALTLAMRDSGLVLDHGALPGAKVDKHSTGGVGDKISLVLAPLVAAAGVPIPMISGRGLGHTGGTIDKLQAIPGYRTDLTVDEFAATLAADGFVMAGASAEIAPADRRMYAVRDVTGTVESIPLITSSILAKKLAEGLDGLVLDVKFGRAAFMRARPDAELLMKSLVSTGAAAGVSTVALLTDMDTPLGHAIGNALEVAEIVDCLAGRGPADVMELTYALGAEMLLLAGVDADAASARRRLEGLIADGAARERFAQNVARQGGDAGIVDDPSRLGRAPIERSVPAPRAGTVVDVDPLEVGLVAMDLGAGRRQPTDDVDPLVGVVLRVAPGARVESGDELAVVHARDDAAAAAAAERLTRAIRLGDGVIERPPLIADRLAATP